MDEYGIENEIEMLEERGLTENQQRLMNYLRANIDDLVEVFAD